MLDIFAAVDISAVLAWVVLTGIVIVGIALVFKGIDIAKRAVDYLDSEYNNPIRYEDRPENWDNDDWERNYADGYERELKRRNGE
jgi:hypothetical protein